MTAANKWGTVMQVARWEFNRFFKIRNVISGVLWTIGFAVIGGIGGYWLAASSVHGQIDIAVADWGPYTVEEVEHERFHFMDYSQGSPDTMMVSLREGNIDGILFFDSTDEARLKVHGEPGWTTQISRLLDELRTGVKLDEHGIDAGQFEDLTASVALEILNTREHRVGTADKILAGAAIGLVLMAVFLGFAYQFTAITGEKQQRITEQVVAAIEPQAWIDGKILGISAIGIAYVLIYGSMGVFGAMVFWFIAPSAFQNVILMIDPVLLVTFLLLAILGVLMWNSFLAAVAATIDDPNASERSGLMLLPTVPVMFAFYALVNADSTAITFMGWFPLTSYAVLPARMVLTDVAFWEPILALVLLVATVWLFRKAAGRIFAVAMLIYGKEPGLREMYYWFRRA
ncbi:ABC transporter permease [Balneolales bacterium ANBcel1]|nr:ABC transporter permease [Balneolales bacterium ANBcel1]